MSVRKVRTYNSASNQEIMERASAELRYSELNGSFESTYHKHSYIIKNIDDEDVPKVKKVINKWKKTLGFRTSWTFISKTDTYKDCKDESASN